MKASKNSIFSFSKAESAKLALDNVGVNLPFSELANQDTEGFGWWGQSNNANVYQNIDVKKELLPKPEDFVKVPFRLISATTVGAGSWKVTDFSNEAVLKASMKKLVGKPVYPNHDSDDVFNYVGIIESVKWTEARMQDGQMIPAGIDGIIAIDGKTSPKIARGVLMGAIFSNSVTVNFDWEPSHFFESLNDFYNKIGTIHTDGKMVRRVVTNINDYYESSLVWLGADPFAKAIDKDGNLKNVDTNNIYTPFNKDDNEVKGYEADKSYKISFALDQKTLSLLNKSTISTQTGHNNSDMKELIALFKNIGLDESALRLALKLGEGQEITPDHIKAFMTASPAAPTTVTVLPASLLANESAVTALGTITEASDFSKVTVITNEAFAALNKQVEELKKDAEVGKTHIQAKRDEVKRLYGVTVGEQDAAVLTLIDNAAPEALDGLLKQYTKGATQKFEGKCKKCRSNEFDFQSSLTETDQPKSQEVKTKSFEDIHEKHYGKRKGSED